MDFIEIVTQIPAVGAILLISYWFLKALKSRDCTLRDIADKCHEMRREGADATRDNTRVLGETGEVIREATTLLRAMNGKSKN